MKTMTKLIIAAFASAALLPVAAMAAGPEQNQGLVGDTRGMTVMSGTGLCWEHIDADITPVGPACNEVVKPVAAAATVEPAVIAAPPVQAMPQKFSFSGDALFAFDKSELKPEGKTMLDGLVSQLNGASYDSIVVTGHTDRFGSNKYNQKLSERRAQTVKNYLVSQNVQAGRIDAEGKGEVQPMTKAGDCRGAKSAKVIACLQPDRRVDVEMSGSKIKTAAR